MGNRIVITVDDETQEKIISALAENLDMDSIAEKVAYRTGDSAVESAIEDWLDNNIDGDAAVESYLDDKLDLDVDSKIEEILEAHIDEGKVKEIIENRVGQVVNTIDEKKILQLLEDEIVMVKDKSYIDKIASNITQYIIENLFRPQATTMEASGEEKEESEE